MTANSDEVNFDEERPYSLLYVNSQSVYVQWKYYVDCKKADELIGSFKVEDKKIDVSAWDADCRWFAFGELQLNFESLYLIETKNVERIEW